MQNEESLTTLLTNLANTDLDKLISYKNSKGKEFKSSVRDILTHVAMHGHYHQGQINYDFEQMVLNQLILTLLHL